MNPQVLSDFELARNLVFAHSLNPIAYQILNPGIRHWFSRRRDAVIGYIGLPPLDTFPRLRRPLRWIVGRRVRHFDAIARDTLARVPNTVHIPVQFSARPDMFSQDGLHPTEASQRRLAKIIAGTLVAKVAERLPEAMSVPPTHSMTETP